MIRIYTEDEWNQVWEEGFQSGQMIEYPDGCEWVSEMNRPGFQAQHRGIPLCSGLMLNIYERYNHETWGAEEEWEGTDPLTLAFQISGAQRVDTFGVKEDYCEQAGESYLFFFEKAREIEQFLAGHELNIRIRVAPEFLRILSAGQPELLPTELKLFLEANTVPSFHREAGKQTAAMQLALQQILQCPFQGMLRRVYLEAKALELIALQFAQLVDSPSDTRRLPTIKPDDRDRIYQARNILIRNLAHPPSVIDLAQQVGINELKLRQGFREILNNTVFGYLRNTQMNEARQLLLERNTTVAGVAARVGYASPTAFNAAFRKQFGMSPKEYQMANRIR